MDICIFLLKAKMKIIKDLSKHIEKKMTVSQYPLGGKTRGKDTAWGERGSICTYQPLRFLSKMNSVKSEDTDMIHLFLELDLHLLTYPH